MYLNNNSLGNLPSHKKSYRFLIFVVIIFMIGILTILYLIRAPQGFPTDKIFYFEEGQSLKVTAQTLEDAHVIRSKAIFQTITIAFGGEKKMNSGYYMFKNPVQVTEIARDILRGIHGIPQAKFTIPEGFSRAQIAGLFDGKLSNFDTGEFMKQTFDKEGYLFPETYFFYVTEDTTAVVKKLESTFSKKVDSLFTSGNSENSKTVLSKKDSIIFASIVEAEAGGDKDRKVIAGILYKRLTQGERLQVDASPETYKTSGLPNVPINNPGLKSIIAVLNPVSTPYYFYLHDKKGTVHYAVTYAEHLKNIKLYLK